MWCAVGKKRFCPNLHKRTTLKLLIPNLTFSEPIDMGENVWIYMGELCPAYCLYMPQEDGEEKK